MFNTLNNIKLFMAVRKMNIKKKSYQRFIMKEVSTNCTTLYVIMYLLIKELQFLRRVTRFQFIAFVRKNNNCLLPND